MCANGILGKFGDSSSVVDLTGTSLKTIRCGGIMGSLYLPDSVTSVDFLNCGLPILSENSDLLSVLSVLAPYVASNERIAEFFSCLEFASSLGRLTLGQLTNWGITSLSDYIDFDMPSVTFLGMTGYTATNKRSLITDLNGLEHFENLTELSMSLGSNSLDISAVSSCLLLTTIDFNNCGVQDLTGIGSLTKLTTLTLSNNSIVKLHPLQNLTDLTTLNLQNNAIYDTSEDDDGNLYNNLQILIDLYNNGSLRTLYLSGNSGLNTESTEYQTLLGLTWTDSDF